ncbi:MAG: hypothetical protein DRN88_03045 [Candidatus Hydrothermarchaeota archaeon]|nr:MAG: hypothetical protein DRN88_03045 [Candidatus Hydrothermarchaeota archaeon]
MNKKEIISLRRDIVDRIARVSELWGLDESVGIIFGALLFSSKPLALEEIAEISNYSVSSVCQKMKLLENLGYVRRIKKSGSKKIYYEVEYDLANMIKRFIEASLKNEIMPMISTIDEYLEKYKKLLNSTKDEKEKSEIENDIKKLILLRKNYEKAKKYLLSLSEVVL